MEIIIVINVMEVIKIISVDAIGEVHKNLGGYNLYKRLKMDQRSRRNNY